MNAIEIMERVDFYMDTTRNARFMFADYNKAVNDAIRKFVDDMFGDLDDRNPYSLQSSQPVRDNLFTLLKTATIVPSALPNVNTPYGSVGVYQILNPADYYELVNIWTLIDGVSTYARPTSNNQLGPLMEDSFKAPSNKQPYFSDNNLGYEIYASTTGTFASTSFTYIKIPATFSIGNESQVLNPGIVLTIGLDYIAIEACLNNTVLYQPGQLFNAGATQLVSGQAILASNTTTTDLPAKVHNEIAKMAAAIMQGTVADYNRSGFAEKEAKDS